MLKIDDEDTAVFEELNATERALQMKVVAFSRAMQTEYVELQTKGKAHWAAVLAKYGIEGQWRYEDGKLHPMQQPVDPGHNHGIQGGDATLSVQRAGMDGQASN
jgi:hypothetical protein